MTDIVERLLTVHLNVASRYHAKLHREAAEELVAADKAEAMLRDEILSLRSRAEKAEAELLTMTRKFNGAVGLKDQQRMRAEAAEATCEKLAAALDESRAAHLLLIAPQHIVGSSVIEALTKVTAAELSARTALSAYRNVTTVNASGPKGETPENSRDGGAE